MGAHEKGGVEGEVGRFRRNRLSPMPEVDSPAELNGRLMVWDEADEGRRIDTRIRSVGEDFATERPLLASLPEERFDPGLPLSPRVDRSSLVTVRMAKYSVPSRLIGRQVRVFLGAAEVVIFDGCIEVARHARVVARGGESVDLDHYLEVLKMKPDALPGSTALAAARASGAFTSAHDAFWAAARKTDGDSTATRQLTGVLLLHRPMVASDVVAGLRSALLVGAVTADVVAVEARQHEANGGATPDRHRVARGHDGDRHDGDRHDGDQHDGQFAGPPVVSLTRRRLADPAAVIAGLPADTRPLPSVDVYDQLLRLPERVAPATALPAAQKGTAS